MQEVSDILVHLLSDSPLLVLFVVLSVGAPLGKIRFGKVNLGIASILFTGLAFGSLSPEIKLPPIIYEFGLVIFIYCIGISSGEQFFGNLRNKGWKENVLVFLILAVVTFMIILLSGLSDLKTNYLAGLFAGGLTNTPALAGILEYIRHTAPIDEMESLLTEPVVAYSVCYPMGIASMIMAILIFQKTAGVSLTADSVAEEAEKITNATVSITSHNARGETLGELIQEFKLRVVFGRIKRAGASFIAKETVRPTQGDLLTVVGKSDEVKKAIDILGKKSDVRIDMDQEHVEMRRIFVSNAKIIGHSLRNLNLTHTMGFLITRIRRGDLDVLPGPNTTLQFGDRVRVLTGKNEQGAASKFFGDSYAAQSNIDILTLGLGISVGFFLGMIPISIPGDITLKLGIAGGPLVVALILGAINRIGKLSFVMPYSANNTIRQIGLVLFLAGVGTRSGYAFRQTIVEGNEGWKLFLIGMVLTFIVGILFLFFGHLFLKLPYPKLAGMLAGMQTQPALLAFVNDQAKNELPNIGYASTFPIATLTKIIAVQLILTLSG